MSKNIHFTPGPSALYFTVEQHIRTALREQIPELSHRSKVFSNIIEETIKSLRALLKVPNGYHMVFTSSATEIWERSIQGLVENESYHLVNGSFSARYHAIASQLGINALKQEAELGNCPDYKDVSITDKTELISITQNETSTGVAFPLEDIYAIRKQFPNPLIAVDVVSATPYINLDISKIDMVYFSVQKCFGLPSGLGVWIYNDRCLELANRRNYEGKITGTYHSLTSLHKSMQKFQTPETPNMLNIYLLGQVAKDMINKGIDKIRQETDYKSALLYNLFETHGKLTPFVKDKAVRSSTVAVATVADGSASLINNLSNSGLVVGSGYGANKNNHIRVANFPTHSKEQMELLVDHINKWT